jgi:N-carbamoyl-L-amino-acid hydrolase
LLQQAERRLAERIAEIAARVGVSVETRSRARLEPVEIDKRFVAAVEAGANRLGMSNRRMPSGAGHDAQMLTRICPAAMIFVPSVDGISHNIQELTHPADLENGANLLLATVLETARSGANQEKQ